MSDSSALQSMVAMRNVRPVAPGAGAVLAMGAAARGAWVLPQQSPVGVSRPETRCFSDFMA